MRPTEEREAGGGFPRSEILHPPELLSASSVRECWQSLSLPHFSPVEGQVALPGSSRGDGPIWGRHAY